MNEVKRTERGWAGHFICSNRCRFRRNTLLECGEIQIVVSTVGLMESYKGSRWEADGFEPIGAGDRYYETMAFHADPQDTRYHDIDVERQISFETDWAICEVDADDKANDMHETIVLEIESRLLDGDTFE